MGLAVVWQRIEGALIFLSVLGLVWWSGSPLAPWALVLVLSVRLAAHFEERRELFVLVAEQTREATQNVAL